MKKTKLHYSLTALLLAVFMFGSVGVGFWADKTSEEIQAGASIVKISPSKPSTKKIKFYKRKSSLRRRLVAQLAPTESVDTAMARCMYTPPADPQYTAEFISQETRVWAPSGGDFEATLYVKNTGNTAWFGDASGCSGVSFTRLGTAKERDRASIFYNQTDIRWAQPNRITMIEDRVDPGEVATFSFSGRAQQTSDIFREYFQPVVEGQAWIERTTSTGYLDVYVGEVNPEVEAKLRYVGNSRQASTLDLSGEPVIDIDISEQKLRFKFGNTLVREFTVSTGTFNTPTPIGSYRILNKQELRIGSRSPHYHMPHWQGFTQWGHGLHALPYLANDEGTFWEEALDHIGLRVSHGCVRMLDTDAADLYRLTEIGMLLITHH